MALITLCMERLRDAWLWNMTLGHAFIPVSWLCCTFLLSFMKSFSVVRAAWWSGLAVIVGFALFSAFFIGVGVLGLGLIYEPSYPAAPCAAGRHAILGVWALLAACYTTTEFLFWRVTQRWHHLSRVQSLYLALLANSVAALLLFFTVTCQL